MAPKSNQEIVPFLKGKIYILQALLDKIEDYKMF